MSLASNVEGDKEILAENEGIYGKYIPTSKRYVVYEYHTSKILLRLYKY